LAPEHPLFILGANGSGKSSLLHSFYAPNKERAQRISAHRQTWFDSNTVAFSPLERRTWTNNIMGIDVNPNARWTEHYAGQRTNIALYDLVDAENIRAREIAAAVDTSNIGLAEQLAKKDAPIKTINHLLRQSNIPIAISIHQNDQVVARKLGGQPYSIAQLSDGERNALLLASTVLTSKAKTLFLVDEPERHLHRSIISPLITLLASSRPDCYFVVSTHELMLPIDNPSAQTIVIRDCTITGDKAVQWDAELLPSDCPIDDDLKEDILGARRKIVFVEGINDSLDKPLYSIVFPSVSVVAKESCRDVEHAVTGIRGAAGLHWVQPFGIVDNDAMAPEDVEALRAKGVYAVSVFAVESIYYHTDIQRRVVARLAAVTGVDPVERVAAATVAALAAVEPHVQRLSERLAVTQIRGELLRHMPGKAEAKSGGTLTVTIDVDKIVNSEKDRLKANIAKSNLAAIIARYPVRESPVLTVIAHSLGFQSREQYEAAVRTLLMEDTGAVTLVRSLFGNLPSDLGL
jgi:ABC-type cobalamin/Fe3+-siderophores transport system ATPase subunit